MPYCDLVKSNARQNLNDNFDLIFVNGKICEYEKYPIHCLKIKKVEDIDYNVKI